MSVNFLAVREGQKPHPGNENAVGENAALPVISERNIPIQADNPK
jgi:hypothetical protein